MNVLVTGGGGFLGGRVVRMLLDRGDSVAVFGRSRYPQFDGTGVRCIQGDIRDTPTLQAACTGMDAVVHTAGLPGIWGRKSDFWSINFDGTRSVLAACRAAGVSKLVYTSTPSVVFGRDELCGVDESQPYPKRYLTHYAASKAAAEREVLAANGPRLATIAMRPHLIWGPGDPHLIPRVIARARAGRLRQVGAGGNLVDVTYIDNAARAHLLALDRLAANAPCAGRAYFISQGEPVDLWPWLRQILSAVGIQGDLPRVSHRIAYVAGSLLEVVHKIARLRGEPLMTRFLATQLAKSHYFSIAAARRDLGYSPWVSTETGLKRLTESFRPGIR